MIAYGASVGGMATIIGTPPNLLVAGFLERLAGVRVSFADWLCFGAPVAAVLLVVSLGLTRLVLGRGLARSLAPDAVGRATRAERRRARPRRVPGARWTVIAFSLAFALWLAPSLAQGALGRDHPFATALGKHFPEAGVALLAAGLLFVAPVSLAQAPLRAELGGRPARQLGRADAVRRRAVARHARRGDRDREMGGRGRRERRARNEPRGLHARLGGGARSS